MSKGKEMDLRETAIFLEQWEAEDDLKAILETPAGRRFIWRRIIGRTGVMATDMHIIGSFDLTAARLAVHNFGKELMLEIMHKFPALFLIMQEEAIKHEQRKRDEEDNRTDRGRD